MCRRVFSVVFVRIRTLDSLGNWSAFVLKTSGTTDLNQSRTQNLVNEITGITASTGDNWYDPTYDLAGNMATGPRPSAPKDSDANGRKFKYTYDAWQRLVKVEESPPHRFVRARPTAAKTPAFRRTLRRTSSN